MEAPTAVDGGGGVEQRFLLGSGSALRIKRDLLPTTKRESVKRTQHRTPTVVQTSEIRDTA